MSHRRTILIFALSVSGTLLGGCGGRAYMYESVENVDIRGHAETQSEDNFRVTASVLGREETEEIFGLSLYDQGIQPVWLEVENKGTVRVRYAPVGTDRFYFSPFEVAYKNRSGFSDEARAEMERRFHRLSMPRYIDAGETRSGFVFTNADNGAKGFNVDLFGNGDSLHFTFLMRVPGFVPDYANVDFESIYKVDEISTYAGDDLYTALKGLACCSANESGAEVGDPINIAVIGAGKDLLRAFLRSGWVETSVVEATDQSSHFLFGRSQDAIFRYHSFAGDSFYELRLWLAPIMTGGDRVWAGQVRHFYKSVSVITQFDPDVDNARNFAMQNLIYGQSIKSIGWIAGQEVAPVESFWTNLIESPFFSDGYRLVLWLSGDPYSLLDASALDWDRPPGWNR